MRLWYRRFFGRHTLGILLVSAKKQGQALALYAGLGNLAPGLFAMLLPGLVVALGFITSYVLWFGMLLVLVLIFMKDAPYFQYRQMGYDIDPDALLLACGEELIPSGNVMDSVKKAAADWRTWALTDFYFVSFGGCIALTVWLPTYWAEFFSTALVTAGTSALSSCAVSLVRLAKRQKKGATAVCRQCGEAFDARQGRVCLACQGAAYYRPAKADLRITALK